MVSAPSLSAPPVVVALAFLPAVLWGIEPVLSKRGMAAGGTPTAAALTVVVVDSLLFWVALVLTQGIDVFASLTLEALGIFVFAGAVGTALGRLAVFAGVRRVGASVTSACAGAQPVVATALAAGLLGEYVGLSTALGVALLAAGIATFARSRGGDAGGWQRYEILIPLAAATFFAVGNVVRRFGLGLSSVSLLEAVAINETAAAPVLAGYFLVLRGRTSEGERAGILGSRRALPWFVASGLVTAVALLALFAALAHPAGRVAVVDPIAALAPLFTPPAAALFLRDVERVTGGVVVGTSLAVAGAVLVAVSPAV